MELLVKLDVGDYICLGWLVAAVSVDSVGGVGRVVTVLLCSQMTGLIKNKISLHTTRARTKKYQKSPNRSKNLRIVAYIIKSINGKKL